MRNNAWYLLLIGYLLTIVSAVVALHIMSTGDLPDDFRLQDLVPFQYIQNVLE